MPRSQIIDAAALSLPLRQAIEAAEVADASRDPADSARCHLPRSVGASRPIPSGDMRVIGDPERTRFVVDLQKSPDYGILRLANPYRLVIDLPEVDFKDPAQPGSGRGLISDYRYGLIAPGKARIVLDLSGPVEVVNTFVLDPVGNEPARLVIDLVPTTPEVFAKAADRDRPVRMAVDGGGGGRSGCQSGPPGRGYRSGAWRNRFRRTRRRRAVGEGHNTEVRAGA